MFRRRDEEENAFDAANTELKTATTFGNFMENEVEEAPAKKEAIPTARSLFGIPTAKQQPAPIVAPISPTLQAAPTAPAAEETEVASPFLSPFQNKTLASTQATETPFGSIPTAPSQLSAEKTGVTGLFSRPASAAETQSKANTYKLSAGGALTPAAIGAGSSASANTNLNSNISATKAQTTTGAGMSNIDKIETEKRLTVGYGITLEGKISNCDKLIVYGHVHADLTDVKTLHISESGKFSGFAAIENAEISGAFEGDLIVENSIVINSTGKMSGKVTYGSIEIKPGGKFTGQIVDAADVSPAERSKKTAKKKDAGSEEFKLSPEPIESAKEKEELFA